MCRVLNEVLSITAQESKANSQPSPSTAILNEVLSITAQESADRLDRTIGERFVLNEVLSITAQECSRAC